MATSEHPHRPSRREDFEIAIVCALPVEFDAVALTLDQFWDEAGDLYGRAVGDQNMYTTGRIGNYDVVLTLLPNIGKVIILAGICGGVPGVGSKEEILLGDVIISKQVIQYDIGRQYPSHFMIRKTPHDILRRPNRDIRTLITNFQTDHVRRTLERETTRFLLELQEKAKSQGPETRYEYPGPNDDKFFERIISTDTVRQKGAIAFIVAWLQRLEKIKQREESLRIGTEVTNTAYNPAIFVGVVGSGDAVMN